MNSKDVIELYKSLDNIGINIWIDGGWSVDALLGKQTRPHKDLDIAIEWKKLGKLLEHLTEKGYKQLREDNKWNIVWQDDKGHEIDIHAFIYDDQGNIVDGIMYPTDSLKGTGEIDGSKVRCISPKYQIQFLAKWIHKWPEKYLDAVSALCEEYEIELPEEYRNFKQYNNLVIKAAQNNADWCDIVCRTHGAPGEFLENIWINKQEVPSLLYPNVVTIEPFISRNINEFIETLKSILLETYAIKDSFNELEMDQNEYKTLFEAEWIMHDQGNLNHSISTEGWTILQDEKELEKWEYAWNNNQATEKRIFLPDILSVKDVFFLAKYTDSQIVAGGIVNISRDVIGLSNVFTQKEAKNNVYSELSIFIKEKISTLPIVDYERDEALVQAQEAGFKTIGKLKVLLKT